MSGVKMSDNWLGTNSGRRILLAAPAQGEIDLNDIADGLSKVCRFNGQIKQWYSVAEHCIHVSELVPTQWKGIALLHDATEAFLCDIPTPLKRELGEAYTAIEDRLARVIAAAFGLDANVLVELPDLVKQADTIMAVTERDALQSVVQRWPDKYENALRYPKFRVKYDTPAKAREAWLKAMSDIGMTLNHTWAREDGGYVTAAPVDGPNFSGSVGYISSPFRIAPVVGDPGEAAENW